MAIWLEAKVLMTSATRVIFFAETLEEVRDGSVDEPRVELGVVPAHALVAGPPPQYSEGDREGTTGRISDGYDTGYSNIRHSCMTGDGPLIRES